MRNTLIDQKDFILKAINHSSNSSFLSLADEIVTSMKWTRGLWKELDYCYKAAELLELIYQRASKLDLDKEGNERCQEIMKNANRQRIIFANLHYRDLYKEQSSC